MKKVLVVEDERDVQAAYADIFKSGGVLLLQAFTTDAAAQIFAEHPDIDAAIMDGIMPGEKNIIVLVHEMRRRMKGPILATSSHDDLRREMVAAGASQGATKHEAPFLILRMLGK
jgi:CheY-like chemotaxis protein